LVFSKQAQHVFAEPGYNASSGVYTVINNSKASWRGKMNSWWWGGKNVQPQVKLQQSNLVFIISL